MKPYNEENLFLGSIPESKVIKTYQVGYMDLPDAMYKDLYIDAKNEDEAYMLAEIEMYKIYNRYDFTCLGCWVLNVRLHDFNFN